MNELLFVSILILTDIVDVFGSTAAEIIGGAELTLIHQAQECIHNVSLKLSAA